MFRIICTGILAILSGALSAYTVGSLEEYLNYIFSLLISDFRWDFVVVLFELLYDELFTSACALHIDCERLFCDQFEAADFDADHVDFMDRLSANVSVFGIDLFQRSDDHRIHT